MYQDELMFFIIDIEITIGVNVCAVLSYLPKGPGSTSIPVVMSIQSSYLDFKY